MGRVCRLQLLLALASAVILGSKSRVTRDHIVACYTTEDAVQIVNWFYYNLHVRNYNHLLHSYTFTQFTSTTL
jgi:hypothetical protein